MALFVLNLSDIIFLQTAPHTNWSGSQHSECLIPHCHSQQFFRLCRVNATMCDKVKWQCEIVAAEII